MELTEYLRQKYSERSVAGYRYGVERYVAAVGGEAASVVADYATILDYVAGLRRQKGGRGH